MLAASSNVQAKAAMQVIGQLEASVMGKMTPVLQVTDTDVARLLKVIAEEVKDEVRQELKMKALKEKIPATYRCFAYEVLKILKVSLDRLEAKMAEEQIVLKACRRNGLLSYRPDFEKRQLVRCDAQAWCAGMPEGSHRLKASWLEGRYTWLDDAGRPRSPDFSRMEAAKALADMQEAEYCSQQAVRIGGEDYLQVAIDIGECSEATVEEKKAIEDMQEKQTHPSLMHLYRTLGLLLSRQALEDATEKATKMKARKRAREAAAIAFRKLKRTLKADMKGLSKADLLARLKPVAGKKKKATMC